MVAAQVAHNDGSHHMQSSHSPEYRQATSNGSSVSFQVEVIPEFFLLYLFYQLTNLWEKFFYGIY